MHLLIPEFDIVKKRNVIPDGAKRRSGIQRLFKDTRSRVKPGMTMMVQSILIFMLSAGPGVAQYNPGVKQETWANWERRLARAYDEIKPRKMPGSSMGILVPYNPRKDILPMTAYGYEVLQPSSGGTIVFLMPAPDNYPLNGLVMPQSDLFVTPFGNFSVDDFLRTSLQNIDFPIFVDSSPFSPALPKALVTQFAAIKYLMRGKVTNIKFLPIMVKFKDINSQTKDLGPFLAETIRDIGIEDLVKIVVLSDVTYANNEPILTQVDNILMNAIGALDVDSLIDFNRSTVMEEEGYTTPDMSSIALGVMALRWLGADHGEVLAYAHSGQLVRTKDKSRPQSYVVAGFASDARFPSKVPHVEREKYVKIFDELLRSDLLTLARQSVNSVLDPAAAKPASLVGKQASKKWPIYISLYDPEGELAGEAGTHKGDLPLNESIRKYSLKAVNAAKPAINKTNAQKYTVEVSIPYGFYDVDVPEDLIALLNGIVVSVNRKAYGFHPNRWRTYPNPHQLLGSICFKLGLKPWAYSTKKADIESFRVLSFNEKEPFQDLGAENRRKKKKKKKEKDPFEAIDGGGGDFDAGFPF